MPKLTLTNITDGPRGVHTTAGLAILDPKETREVELSDAEAKDLSEEWFETGKPPKDPLDHDGDGKKGGGPVPKAKEGE